MPHMHAGLDSHQQRLRLGDLGHLGRWRKAFECGREDGVAFGRTTGRLVEPTASAIAARRPEASRLACADFVTSIARRNAASTGRGVGGIVLR